MCLIALAVASHPDYPLVVAANRDEHHARPAAAAAPWPEDPAVIGGRDLEAGGAWLGVRRDGRFGAVTNVRRPDALRPGARSRGHLVRDWLLGDDDGDDPAAFLAPVRARRGEYAPFNLVLGGPRALWVYASEDDALTRVAPGVHALSNARLDTPWPKVRRATAGLAAALGGEDPDRDALRAVLADRGLAPDDELPDTGVGLALERVLSPPFIVGERYGTRASTLVLFGADGRIAFEEARFGPNGAPLGVTRTTLTPP
ncbi:MAG: NRDE family protein [Deltaproteobacteria bacterium]|nr:NRDE family protein [Deltaproteobacteria bacterium]